MKCPIDETELQMSERQGIEIDYCSKCRGVWLDRGELDKIIDRSAEVTSPQVRDEQPRYQEERNRPYEDERGYGHQKKHKREGFLGELFDF